MTKRQIWKLEGLLILAVILLGVALLVIPNLGWFALLIYVPELLVAGTIMWLVHLFERQARSERSE